MTTIHPSPPAVLTGWRVLLPPAGSPGPRAGVDGPEPELSADGQLLAAAIPTQLEGLAVNRIVSAPQPCCRQTLTPLSLALERDLEVADELGAATTLGPALRLLRDPDMHEAVVCAPREVLRGLLDRLPAPRPGRHPLPPRPAATWLLEPRPQRAGGYRLRQLPVPAWALPTLRRHGRGRVIRQG